MKCQNYKDEVFKLKDFNKSHNSNEQALKDKNWELESKVIKLDDELSVLKKSHEKTIHENSELANQISNLNKINDKLEISNQSLTKSLHDTKQSYQSEILALNAQELKI